MGRVLVDSCIACNLSLVACDAKRHTFGTACCGVCSHLDCG